MPQKTFYITTPIYYPSGELHIGHVYSTTLAWVLRNYKKMRGYKTLFLTGSDEHGQKIAQTAQTLQLLPQHYVDQMAQKFQNLWKDYQIDYDLFSRTTSANHKQTVQQIFKTLSDQDDIYLGHYEGWYSVQDEEFLTKTQAILKDDKYYHPISNHVLEKLTEESFFLKLSNYESWLKEYLVKHPHFIIPKKVVHELFNNFLDPGLEELSITRTTFSWGIPIMDDKKYRKIGKHYIYVWLDALSNYISALGYKQKNHQLFDQFWQNGDEIVHVIGKEIARFHGIYWPIMLKALNLKLPNTILSHGWLITPEGKMSKSKGNVINPYDLLQLFDPETVKYYLASQINLGQDGVFSVELVKTVYNADLANNFGNLVSRTVTLVAKNFPQGIPPNQIKNQEINNLILASQKQYIHHFDNFEIAEGLKVALHLSKTLNGYIEKTTPWNLSHNLIKLGEILINLLNGIYCIAMMLSVVLPKKITTLFQQLNIANFDWKSITNWTKFYQVPIAKNAPLFLRLK